MRLNPLKYTFSLAFIASQFYLGITPLPLVIFLDPLAAIGKMKGAFDGLLSAASSFAGLGK